jgi:hypothetical protein
MRIQQKSNLILMTGFYAQLMIYHTILQPCALADDNWFCSSAALLSLVINT